MRNYLISAQASLDLDEILSYLARINLEAAEQFLQKFDQKCRNLVNFPNLGRSYSEFAPDLRGMPLNGYIIFYQVSEASLIIVRVISGYRDLQTIFTELNDE